MACHACWHLANLTSFLQYVCPKRIFSSVLKADKPVYFAIIITHHCMVMFLCIIITQVEVCMIRHVLFVFLNLNLNLGVCNLFLIFIIIAFEFLHPEQNVVGPT